MDIGFDGNGEEKAISGISTPRGRFIHAAATLAFVLRSANIVYQKWKKADNSKDRAGARQDLTYFLREIDRLLPGYSEAYSDFVESAPEVLANDRLVGKLHDDVDCYLEEFSDIPSVRGIARVNKSRPMPYLEMEFLWRSVAEA